MASIYQPQGPSVRLRGPEVNPGFKPVEAPDFSRQILDKAGVDLRRSEADITALSNFSGTLNKFLVEKTEERNKAIFDEHVAKALMGQTVPKPGALEEFNEKRDALQSAAAVDAEIVSEVEQESPLLANTVEHRSVALKGWAGYGTAVGFAKRAAASAPFLLQEFMQSDEPVVPITRPNGTIDLISPREAGYSGDMAEIAAAQQVGIQRLIEQAGLSGINPIILAEHLTPTVMSTQAAIASNRAMEVRKYRKEEAVELVKGRMSSEIATLDYNDSNAVQGFWQQNTRDLSTSGQMGLGESNKTVVESIIADAKALKNKDILTAFANTPLIAEQPNGVTVGERFRSLFEAASREMDSYEETERARAQKQEDDFVDDVLAAHNLILATPGATKEQIAQSFAITTEQLRSVASSKSLNALLQLEQRGQNYNPLMAGMLQQDIAAGVEHSAASIDRLAVEGVITPDEASRLKKGLPSSAAAEKVNGMKAEILTQARGQMKFVLDSQGISQSDGASITEAFASQMASEVMAKLNNMIIANPSMSDAEMRQFYVAEMQALSKQPRFTPEIDATGQIKVPNLEPEARVLSFRNPTTGQMVRDLSQAPAAVVQSTRANAVRDFLVNPQELTQNAQAFIQGGQPTPRVRALMSVTGKDWQTFLRDQHQVRGLSFTNMSQAQAAQAAQQRRALAPADAAILAHPNATPQQRVNAWNNIEAARQRQAQREAGKSLGPSDLKPGSQVQIPDMVGLAQEAGFTREQAVTMSAIAMAESSGNSGAHNNNRATGDDSYGLWQINMIDQLGPSRRQQFGINSNEQLKDPRINARAAKAVFDSQGFNAWSVYRSGAYRQYLPEARRALSGSFSGAQGGRANFTPQNVQSIRIETPGSSFQPGLDLWFADKKFGAVLPGRVKEIRMNNGNYGNMLVVESISPLTGEKVDVLYSHFDRINVREGQRISPGMVLGRQGGTGRVRSTDGTIASIDFLAPAPKGSNAMTPYRQWKQLSERIKRQIESGTFR